MPRLHILFLALLAAVAAHLASAAGPPHVIVILVDDMGYGDPGCYNPASKIPTPNIDRLAAERQLAWLIVWKPPIASPRNPESSPACGPKCGRSSNRDGAIEDKRLNPPHIPPGIQVDFHAYPQRVPSLSG
jgi:hypothetical protein